MRRGTSGSWTKYGCLTVAGAGAIALLVLGVAAGIAMRQNRAAVFERQALAGEIPEVDEPREPVRLKLEVHTAGVSVKPLGAGESIRIEADYDPRLYELRKATERIAEAVLITVELRPLGSKLIALLRAKLGGRPAKLHIALPRDVPLEVEGHLVRSFAAMELGGLTLTSTSLDVEQGGVKVSFLEPLPKPMDSLSVRGSRGSLSVVGLGHASPRETRLVQHIGAVDLDLRGPWSRDAEIRVVGGAAGGSLWLPENVEVRGLEDSRGIRANGDSELPVPTLELSISEHMGRFVVLD